MPRRGDGGGVVSPEDLDHLRLVPLPDGRVALSTVDDAEFLDLG